MARRGFGGIGSRVYPTFRRGGTLFSVGGRALLPLVGEGGPAEPGRMRVLGKEGASLNYSLRPLSAVRWSWPSRKIRDRFRTGLLHRKFHYFL